MSRFRSRQHVHDLPEGVLLSVQGVSRAVEPEIAPLPKWLARILPKSGIAGQTTLADDFEDEEDPDDEEEELGAEKLMLNEISFDVRAGEGVGIVGPNQNARKVLLQILLGGIPPTTGRVLVRGHVAPLLRSDVIRYTGKEWGESAVFLAARFLHWPRALLRERWSEILEFARLDELDKLSGGQYQNRVTARLLFAAALHMDASVYVLDHNIDFDPEFALHCFELIEQRQQQDGAAVVHGAQKMIDDVSRLCGQVIWLEKDGTTFRGRPVDVAIAVKNLHPEEVHPLSAPILATLPDGLRSVEVPGAVEIELHMLRKDIDFAFTLELTDAAGRTIELEQPDRFQSDSPGLYHLRVLIPQGVLPAATYSAKLLAEIGVVGSEPGPSRELLRFELAAARGGVEGNGEGASFELIPKDEPVQQSNAEMEASVGRALS